MQALHTPQRSVASRSASSGIALGLVVSLLGRVPAADLPSVESGPFRAALIEGRELARWDFADGPGAWKAENQCSLEVADGVLRLESRGSDPYISVAVEAEAPVLLVRLRLRVDTLGSGQFFWTTVESPARSEERSRHFDLFHDGVWHDYEVVLDVGSPAQSLRFDPGQGPGMIEIDSMAIVEARWSPFLVKEIDARPDRVRLLVSNGSDRLLPIEASARTSAGEKTTKVSIEPAGVSWIELPLPAATAIDVVSIEVVSPGFGFPAWRKTISRLDWEGALGEVVLEDRSGVQGLRISFDRSSRGLWIERAGRVLAALAPLALAKEEALEFRVVSRDSGIVVLEADGATLRVGLAGDEIHFLITAQSDVESAIVRIPGRMEKGLFAGLEYLEKGERSSSTLDIETEDHLRYTPDPLHVTLPLMAVETQSGLAALTWTDPTLAPIFASPNVLDGSGDHRMALRGRRIEARLLVRKTALEESIVWAVDRAGGLPPPPAPPRSRVAQRDLVLAGIRGPIVGPGGWGHCAEPSFPRHPYVDVASTIWRLTGELPDLPRLVPGGAHVRNGSFYFVTGRAAEWLERARGEARGLARGQAADGSYRYDGPYRRGHWEDTASGLCAVPTARLLEFAWITGDEEALRAGLKALEYLRRFEVPRGAQTWELSLHTPDILASAYLVWAYVRGWQLTGREDYLRLARKWALSGVPFVYLWSARPVMLYATVPVYGATNWRAPLWIGLPVQWCGGVYAYALTLLAPHEKTLDWARLARGILVAGQAMQYPDGPLIGCLPDAFHLGSQRRLGPSINPCALASLEMALEGEVDSLCVVVGTGPHAHRVLAPFPASLEGGDAVIHARAGTRYQVLIDGTRIVDILSEGVDRVPVE